MVYTNLGYRDVDKDNPDIEIKHRGKDKRLMNEESRLLKRPQAIEPIIGHLKTDYRMDRCHLKGSDGDALRTVLCAAGYNIRWLLQVSGLTGLFEEWADVFNQNRLQNSDQDWMLA